MKLNISIASRVIFAVSAFFPFSVNAGLTGYLKIGDISGESQAAEHEEEIDIHDVMWNIEQGASSADGSRSKVVVKPMVFSKRLDKASPKLALAALDGRTLPSVTLAVRKDSGEAHLDYLIITMENVRVTSYGMKSNEGGCEPVEQVSISFEKIVYKYVEGRDSGFATAGGEHEITYDIAAGV